MSENGARFNGEARRRARRMRQGARIVDELLREAAGRPILIAGPTASGKSALALALAEAAGGAVVNADALQVYHRWRVLTARPGPEEEAAAPHHLYGHVGREEPYSVGRWLRELAPLLSDGRPVVIVGGTGLYFSSLTNGLASIPDVPGEVRRAAEDLDLATLIGGLDAATHARIDLRNPARVRRAWEVLQATGRGLADWQAETGPPLLHPADSLPLVIEPDRDWLATRIDRRFDLMMAEGALEEMRAELPHWDPAHPSARAIGAPELAAHLRGEAGLQDAVLAAKAATRDYARRQKKWFRTRMAGWRRVTPS